VSCLRENFTSSSYGEGLETSRRAPRQSFTRQLFFKSIKQNLRIKTFVGTSANALKIQIWTALIALLLERFLELRSRLKWHASRFIALLRRQLFVYSGLFRFLDYPFECPVRTRQDHLPGQPALFAPSDLPMTNLD
jgi:hypothetical protein